MSNEIRQPRTDPDQPIRDFDKIRAHVRATEAQLEATESRFQELTNALPTLLAKAHQEERLTIQSRLGHRLAPPGGFLERFTRAVIGARVTAKTQGRKALLRKIGQRLLGRRQVTPAGEQSFTAPLATESPTPEKANPLEEAAFEGMTHSLRRGAMFRRIWEAAHLTAVETGRSPSSTFVPFERKAPLGDPGVKFIAFYLPQYHPFPENDEWWERGFTEWTNVSKAVPNFPGHYQPHLPIDNGFYDLRLNQVIERQVELAKNYGLYGFCFYYYWFSGTRLLERPIDAFVQNPNIDFPFCIMWANESWSRRWEGNEVDVLMKQEHTEESDLRFIEDLEVLLRHKNYIHFGGRPVVAVYRPELMPDPVRTTQMWRKWCLDKGLPEPYLVMAQAFGHLDPRPFGFDASVKFPPHNEHSRSELMLTSVSHNEGNIVNEDYEGRVYSFPRLVKAKLRPFEEEPEEFAEFETASPGWDNAARRPDNAVSYHLATPEYFYKWMTAISRRALKRKLIIEPAGFINAWNEWAEGAHLEPDRKFGYGYLDALHRAAENAQYLVSPNKETADKYREAEDPFAGELASPPKSPVVVFQMGKVGSISVTKALRDALPEGQVLHAHALSHIEEYIYGHLQYFKDTSGTLMHLEHCRRVREWLDKVEDDDHINIVTIVRDPVARSVSAFMEALPEHFPHINAQLDDGSVDAIALHESFVYHSDGIHGTTEFWFDRQLKDSFGIDVYDHPFDHARGFQIIEQGKVRLLILRTDRLNSNFQEAIQEFLGVAAPGCERYNTTEDKSYALASKIFKSKALPNDYLDRMYGAKVATHFFTQEELASLRQRWA